VVAAARARLPAGTSAMAMKDEVQRGIDEVMVCVRVDDVVFGVVGCCSAVKHPPITFLQLISSTVLPVSEW
jgi:hypothetical protein